MKCHCTESVQHHLPPRRAGGGRYNLVGILRRARPVRDATSPRTHPHLLRAEPRDRRRVECGRERGVEAARQRGQAQRAGEPPQHVELARGERLVCAAAAAERAEAAEHEAERLDEDAARAHALVVATDRAREREVVVDPQRLEQRALRRGRSADGRRETGRGAA